MIYLYADEKSTAFVELETVTDAKFFSRSHDAVIRVYDEREQRDWGARAGERVRRTVAR